ncbi:hypothetical protein BGZ60DRAFT_181815 [Tricladium varicosporioides]|nr:hypothetical protein BGZ60DRAFT_181815 [Hymenoscyphus varicosporioides]
MSRNFRRKTPETPVQKKVRRSSRATDFSSDDDYDGVDLISDSEEDEPDVEGVEEQAIIESEEDEDEDNDTPRPTREFEYQDNWEGFGTSSVDGTIDETFFDEHMARMHAEEDTETAPRKFSTSSSSLTADTPRRVHFDLSDSDDLDSDQEDPVFPDIFLDQNSLDPKFRRIIENDEDPNLSDDEFWGSVGSDAGKQEQDPNQTNDNESDSDSFTGSSGYESDEGETTDEDLPEVAKFVPARSVLKPIADEVSDDEEEIAVTRRGPKKNGPKLGSFFHDKRNSFAVIDSKGKKLVMFRAKKTARRYSFNGMDARPKLNTIQETDAENMCMEEMSPMISNSGNLMLSAMYTPLDTFVGQAVGPPEAFLPFTSISADGIITHDSTSSFDEDDVDDEELWKLEDFLNFGGQSSESDNDDDDQDPSPSSDTMELSSTPARPTTATSEDQVHPLLNHFNSNDVVGAFRRNQNRHQLLTRNALSSEALAFSGPFGQGTLRGIKGGRLAAANTPITPMRKRKGIQPIGSSPGSPLANLSAANSKRKFDGEYHFGHKRSRSDF